MGECIYDSKDKKGKCYFNTTDRQAVKLFDL